MNAINASSNICQLPATFFLQIRDHWNSCHSIHQGWKAFIAKLEGHFVMSEKDVNGFEREHNPATKLFHELSARGMTIQQFVHFAIKAHDSIILGILNLNVPIQIVENPPETVHVTENDILRLTVEAFGHPQPKYQWYKDGNILENEAQGCFEVASSLEHAGEYCCLIYSEDRQQMLRSSSCIVVVEPSCELEVKEQPRSCHVRCGDKAVFSCEVWGGTGLTYQWYKDEEPLIDTEYIRGSQQNRLVIHNICTDDWHGWYHCEVTSLSGQQQRTARALLQLEDRLQEYRVASQYTAADKVVLLIGCSDYRGDKLLTAPLNDVKTLSAIFQSLGFKVVSLLNLTKLEIISAIHEFKALVSEGVYCVFYFCGHGFETAGFRFLVPTDAPIDYNDTHCIAAEQIFDVLLQRNPRICCMILDTCRRIKPESKPPPLDINAVRRGNSIVCYATSSGLAAFEGKNRGILVEHLRKFLGTPITIESVFSRLRESLGEDHRVNVDNPNNPYRQIPDVKSNLTEPRRSFADRIQYTGYTEAFNRRQIAWQSAHEKPESRELSFPFDGFTVKVQLDFQQEFSNMLKVYVSVIDPGPTTECLAYVSAVPMMLMRKEKNQIVSASQSRTLRQTFVTITNIQKLKSNLNVEITVRCKRSPAEKEMSRSEETDLGKPLMASLELWKERPGLLVRREAVEEEEDEGLDTGDLSSYDG